MLDPALVAKEVVEAKQIGPRQAIVIQVLNQFRDGRKSLEKHFYVPRIVRSHPFVQAGVRRSAMIFQSESGSPTCMSQYDQAMCSRAVRGELSSSAALRHSSRTASASL